MKKKLFTLCVMTLLVSCANEDNETLIDNEHIVMISAKADLTKDSRIKESEEEYVMEIYEDPNYNKMVGVQRISTDGNFGPVTLDRSKTYYALFWADSGLRNTYDVTSLKAVTLNSDRNPIDAFAGKATILGKVNSLNVSLKRVVANINLLEVGVINPKRIRLMFTQPTTYNVATDAISGENARTENVDVTTQVDGSALYAMLNQSPIYVLASKNISIIKFNLQCMDLFDNNKSQILSVNISVFSNKNSNITGHYEF